MKNQKPKTNDKQIINCKSIHALKTEKMGLRKGNFAKKYANTPKNGAKNLVKLLIYIHFYVNTNTKYSLSPFSSFILTESRWEESFDDSELQSLSISICTCVACALCHLNVIKFVCIDISSDQRATNG